MKRYDHKKIESKWQKEWKKNRLYSVDLDDQKPKLYTLDMFPYPSGEGLHVGHPKGYIATDIFSRYKKMNGYNILHPMGWDAFGLPAENYALKHKIHPKKAVEKNIANFKNQINKLGFNYDWSKEINTTDPEYYRWTQWIFLQLFKKGLAYQSEEPIIWCPSCQTGLAQEDLEDGKCERCGSEIEMKPIRQWVLKITDYADRLLEDLEKGSLDWEEQIVDQQKNWIGKSNGAEIIFEADAEEKERVQIKVFTTRADTLFGATFLVLAPEHPLVEKLTVREKKKEVEVYRKNAAKKTDLTREEAKNKTGVFTGSYATNPVNQQKIPVWIADYVMVSYGSGAIMAVPGHDQRDYEFAKKYNLKIISIVEKADISGQAYSGEGKHVNSAFLDGLGQKEANEKIIAYLSKRKLANKVTKYKIRDWVFSRQRYWGEPIPIIHCSKCGPVPVPESDLPVILPDVDNYQPTGTGESPLANISQWVKTTCPKCRGEAQRETNTMPQWAGSCWYYLRYLDPQNKNKAISPERQKNWLPVDLYVGGIEHATRHLLYARFWHKALFDLKIVSTKEPFKRLIHVGLITGADGRKMSKRWGNVINPDEIVEQYGADALRVYEMFMGPFNQEIAWNEQGLKGARKFLDRLYSLYFEKNLRAERDREEWQALNNALEKVSHDIEDFKFNTAVATLMSLLNYLEKKADLSKESFSLLLKMVAPFAPFVAEELWMTLGKSNSIHLTTWPSVDKEACQKDEITIAVQINGKIRDQIMITAGSSQEAVLELCQKQKQVQKYLAKQKIKKVFYVTDRLLSIVTEAKK